MNKTYRCKTKSRTDLKCNKKLELVLSRCVRINKTWTHTVQCFGGCGHVFSLRHMNNNEEETRRVESTDPFLWLDSSIWRKLARNSASLTPEFVFSGENRLLDGVVMETSIRDSWCIMVEGNSVSLKIAQLDNMGRFTSVKFSIDFPVNEIGPRYRRACTWSTPDRPDEFNKAAANCNTHAVDQAPKYGVFLLTKIHEYVSGELMKISQC